METENNTMFAMQWLPTFALDPPTEREVKARPEVLAGVIERTGPFAHESGGPMLGGQILQACG